MDHRALFRWKFPQRVGQLLIELLRVRVRRHNKKREAIRRQLLEILLPRSPPPHEVDGQIVGKAEHEGPLVPDAMEQTRVPSQFNKEFLDHISSVGLVTEKIEQKGEKRLRVVIVKAVQIQR